MGLTADYNCKDHEFEDSNKNFLNEIEYRGKKGASVTLGTIFCGLTYV